jgi:hypothetical protein
MTQEQQVKNIFAFLSIVFGEDLELAQKIMLMPPEYLIEKFTRYIESELYEADWGLHPTLRESIFNRYCRKYNLKITDDENKE